MVVGGKRKEVVGREKSLGGGITMVKERGNRINTTK
jgi:hypothetical protein